MLTSCYVTLFVVLMFSLSNASIDVFIHTEVSLAVHYKCVPGEAFFGEFGSTHKFSVEPSKDSVCHVVWNNLEGTFVALEGAYDRNHNPVYWSVMSGRFECVIHHGCVFVEFNRLGYKRLDEVWQVDPDLWSYFEVLGGLKDLGYPKVERPNGVEEDNLKNGVKGTFEDLGTLNSLEYDTLDELNNGVKETFDDFGTFEDLNNLGDKFDEGWIAGIEDRDAVDQESSCEDVNLDGTTASIDKKDSCQDVNFDGVIVSKDAIVDITLEGPLIIWHVIKEPIYWMTHLIWYMLKKI
ncbi:hypothetical protein KIW84_060400 [Lathyrus oleraceus]|uniref:PB1-like domain-containing protein n=1 Tax=Pisum sativum TaxID=3888 RepID=A0A9D4W2J4_PEA|nr:hypothetical protein KIW84_060400 [Pisum sativum]